MILHDEDPNETATASHHRVILTRDVRRLVRQRLDPEFLDSAPLHLYGQPVASPSEPALAGLVAFSLDLSRLRSTEGVMRRALAGCLELTGSETGFLDLIDEEGSFPPRTRVAGDADVNLVARHRPRLLEQGEHELAVIAGKEIPPG